MCCRLPVISEGMVNFTGLVWEGSGGRNGQFLSADPCVAALYITLWGIRKWETISILIPTLTPEKLLILNLVDRALRGWEELLGAVSPLVSTGASVDAFGSGSGGIWRLLLRRPEVPGWVFSRQTWTGQ